MIITVVIPCYKVARHIENVIKNIPANVQYIIAVNDCSPDETEEILLRLSQENSRIVYIRHEKNQGVGGAMLTGYSKALELKSDITIKMDGDDQMDASLIDDLIKPIIKGDADYTKGNRFRDHRALRQMPFVRRVGNIGLSFFIKAACGYWNIFDPNNGYVAINNEALKNIDPTKIDKRYFFESSMLIELYHVSAVIQEVPMKAKYGDEISNLSASRAFFEFPPKLFKAFVKRIILKYFLYEFNIASVYMLVGIPLFLFGFFYGTFNYIHYVNNNMAAPTGTVVIPTLLITLGFQLLLSAANYDISNYPKR